MEESHGRAREIASILRIYLSPPVISVLCLGDLVPVSDG